MNDQQHSPSQQSGSVTYQTAVLNPSLVETMVIDDSPQILWNKFWAFLGVDIPIADIKEWDFKNILDFVDIAVFEILEEYPEEQWENVVIIEYETSTENGKTVKTPIRAFKVSTLQNLLRAKTYLKMCRAREGFTLKSLTESRSFIEEKTNAPMMSMPTQQPQEKKGGWKIL